MRAGDLIRLEGDLGAGKSELARSVIQSLAGHPIDVPSPTFTLVQRYDVADLTILHADLYRLTCADELDELGLFEDEDMIWLIEWWSRAETALPNPGLTIELSQAASEDARDVTLIADPQLWRDRLDGLLP